MESYELSKYENWMCVEDPFSQIRSQIVKYMWPYCFIFHKMDICDTRNKVLR